MDGLPNTIWNQQYKSSQCLAVMKEMETYYFCWSENSCSMLIPNDYMKFKHYLSIKKNYLESFQYRWSHKLHIMCKIKSWWVSFITFHHSASHMGYLYLTFQCSYKSLLNLYNFIWLGSLSYLHVQFQSWQKPIYQRLT